MPHLYKFGVLCILFTYDLFVGFIVMSKKKWIKLNEVDMLDLLIFSDLNIDLEHGACTFFI